jgi:uncharacterized protein GlcG (DUF336 family)
MRHRLSLAFVAALAVFPLGSASAQVGQSGYSLPLALAMKAATNAIAACASNGYPVSAVVVDPSGVIKLEAKATTRRSSAKGRLSSSPAPRRAWAPALVEAYRGRDYGVVATARSIRPTNDDQILAGAILYLESAGFVTGETIHVDGGQSAGH